jgi:hypothetical protein
MAAPLLSGSGRLVGVETAENDYEDTITRHEYEHAYEYDARRYDYDAAMRGFALIEC